MLKDVERDDEILTIKDRFLKQDLLEAAKRSDST
jgi:hypothetical protein